MKQSGAVAGIRDMPSDLSEQAVPHLLGSTRCAQSLPRQGGPAESHGRTRRCACRRAGGGRHGREPEGRGSTEIRGSTPCKTNCPLIRRGIEDNLMPSSRPCTSGSPEASARKHQSDACDLMVKPGQPRGDSLHRPGGGVGGHPGTLPPSRQAHRIRRFPSFHRRFSAKRLRPKRPNSCDIASGDGTFIIRRGVQGGVSFWGHQWGG